MQTRLTTLETKWDTVIPTLATREDLLALEGRLRDDMRHRFDDFQRWLMTIIYRWLFSIAVTTAIVLGGGATVVMSKRGLPPGGMTLSQQAPEGSDAMTWVTVADASEERTDFAP